MMLLPFQGDNIIFWRSSLIPPVRNLSFLFFKIYSSVRNLRIPAMTPFRVFSSMMHSNGNPITNVR